MESSIQIFKNSQFGEVRVTEIDGEPMFCLPDLCSVLGLSNPSSVKSRLDGGDVQLIDLHALNYTEGIGNQQVNFVNESGFYDVLLQSSSPKVKPFRKWVTSDVLPSIRKHGAYVTAETMEQMLGDPEFAIKMLQTIREERQKRREAETLIEKQAPKVKYYEDVMNSDSLLAVTEIAFTHSRHVKGSNGIPIGCVAQ